LCKKGADRSRLGRKREPKLRSLLADLCFGAHQEGGTIRELSKPLPEHPILLRVRRWAKWEWAMKTAFAALIPLLLVTEIAREFDRGANPWQSTG
jgi:hypothetical protein